MTSGITRTNPTLAAVQSQSTEKAEGIARAVSSLEQPESQGAVAPSLTSIKKAAIMHFSEKLLEPRPLTSGDFKNDVIAGAAYLLEQQTNRQNAQPPKQAYDNVFTSPQVCKVMDIIKSSQLAVQNAKDSEMVEESKVGRAITQTFINVQNLTTQEVDWSQYEKIYIPGAGQAGSKYIYQAGEKYTPKDIVEKLIESSALTSIKDIRITSHASADDKWTDKEQPIHQPKEQLDFTPKWFVDGTTKAVAMGLNLFSHAIGRGIGLVMHTQREMNDRSDQAFAQAISRELDRHGYSDVVVSGYMGQEMPLHNTVGEHQYRQLNQRIARRSDTGVRVKYVNGEVVPNSTLPKKAQFSPLQGNKKHTK